MLDIYRVDGVVPSRSPRVVIAAGAGGVDVVNEDSLSSVLGEFARTLVTEFPIQAILDRLVERIVGVLGVSCAGVTLISPGVAPYYVAASDDAALRFEQLQSELDQGPSLMAYELGEAVAIPDLAGDNRFPIFGPRAVAEGMAAVFTFPLRHGDEQLGALDLYRTTVGPLDAQDTAAAQTLADVAAAYILNARAREEALDVSDRFRNSALHDALTGLPNRALLNQRIDHAAQRARRSHTPAAVLFVDLDRFKRVNDTYGHATGDLLLVGVAERLTMLIRPGDTLARVSGDEFVILCEDLAHRDDAEMLAARIERAFTAPFLVSNAQIVVSASVGIAYSGPGESVTHQLVSHADTAMYQAKRNGGAAHHVIDLRETHEARDRDGLELDLRNEINSSQRSGPQLDVAYQPIVRTKDGLMIGVEALLRWTHPRQGPVSALTAISVAEQSGLIDDLGAWVLERACHDRGAWLAACPERPLNLSVNISARQLLNPGFRDNVAAVLDETAMDPSALVLEVTEGIFIDDTQRAMDILGDLKQLGVRLALDDFGTGFCSLNYLRRFPVDILKIDRSFVADLGHDPVDRAVVASVTELAHVLGMTVTAEGVETEEQRDQVLRIGCESAQGFFYSRAMPSADITANLTRHPGRPVFLPRVPTIPKMRGLHGLDRFTARPVNS
jgi:diguanylate cyclase (GGDEF)-like protein